MRKLVAVLTALAVEMTAGTAHAHHTQAMFDLQRIVEVTGTVREFQWTNPHCYIQLRVRDTAGQEEEWSIEMGAPLHVAGRGWNRGTLKPGDLIKVRFHPLRNGQRGGELVAVTTPDGQPVGKRS